MKIHICKICGNKTNLKGLCTLCKTGLTKERRELIDLLKKDKKYSLLRKLKVS